MYTERMVAEKKPVKKNIGAKKKEPLSMGIHAAMPIADIVALCPESEHVLREWGLSCFGCAGSAFETLADGVRGHGFSEEDIAELIDDLNRLVAEMPERTLSLTVTADAARGIADIAKKEGKTDHALLVTVDGAGGFCMEFLQVTPPDSSIFFHREVPDVRVAATPLTLKRIGGATIDMREGRFKLDLPEDARETACACGGNCACK